MVDLEHEGGHACSLEVEVLRRHPWLIVEWSGLSDAALLVCARGLTEVQLHQYWQQACASHVLTMEWQQVHP